nr:hypothetical protein [Takakia lepidozioides]
MSPVFGFVQMFFYYPFFLPLLYLYLVVFIPIRNTISITNIFYLSSEFMRNKLNFNK